MYECEMWKREREGMFHFMKEIGEGELNSRTLVSIKRRKLQPGICNHPRYNYVQDGNRIDKTTNID